MFKVLTSFSKVIRPFGKHAQDNSFTYRFVHVAQQYRTRLLAHSTEQSVRCFPNLCVTRSCHEQSSVATPRERLKKAVKEYGSVLIVFHVGISLISLGTVYLFISHGVDVQQWIEWMGVSNADESTKIVAGASQFIIAYAIHKSFAPVRISITLVSVPLIVRFLRAKGIMKIKK